MSPEAVLPIRTISSPNDMKPLTTLLIAVSMLLSSLALHAQRSTEFFYLGTVYCKTKAGVEQRFPYLPVYLSRQDKPQDIIAVTITNANGEASFEGVPIDRTRIISSRYISPVVSIAFADLRSERILVSQVILVRISGSML